MLNFIINYWYLIIVAIIVAILGGFQIYKFIKKPSEEKLKDLKEWAIYACALAEAHLGSGTGQLKMRETYDMFITRFPDLAKIISFELYKTTAETALIEFKQMLQNNPKVKELIIKEGEEKYGNIKESDK